MSKHRINLHNKGNHFRDFTYIDDVAETIVKVIKKKHENISKFTMYAVAI